MAKWAREKCSTSLAKTAEMETILGVAREQGLGMGGRCMRIQRESAGSSFVGMQPFCILTVVVISAYIRGIKLCRTTYTNTILAVLKNDKN